MKIVVVDDDSMYARTLQYHLELNPAYKVEIFLSGEEMLKHLYKKPDVVTLDYSMPNGTGLDWLKKIKKQYPTLPVILISGQEDVATAVELLKEGAHDYLVKNLETHHRLAHVLRLLSEHLELKKEVETLREEVKTKYAFSNSIIGNSPALMTCFEWMKKAAATNINVNIYGETGTGKELVAKAIHYNSNRSAKPFIALNMAAFPKELLESELFGYEKGAFTGAHQRKLGKIEEAQGGTLFLDELAEMDLTLQAKLLRVLQEREIQRLGSNTSIKIDVRIITATHKHLLEEVKTGHFREDLYYRINGLPIQMPALRERGQDILVLAQYFMVEFCKMQGWPKKSFSAEAQNKLLAYSYPGNVRELRSVIELACVMADGERIEVDQIHFTPMGQAAFHTYEEESLEAITHRIIQHHLEKYNNNVQLVADRLKIGKSTIYRLLQEHKLK